MSDRIVTLPSGATVTLRDPATLRVKDRKKIMVAADEAVGEMAKTLAIGEALLSVLIKEWSYDLIPPAINPDSLGELEMLDYDALTEETQEAQKYLFPSLADTPENAADAESPFDNSNG